MSERTFMTSFTIQTETAAEAARIVERLGSVMIGYVMDGTDCTLSCHAYEGDEEIAGVSLDSDGTYRGPP